MKPYGIRNPLHKKIDNHPQKGYINWWEDEGTVIKKQS
jgi:hypothetical protein